MVQTLHQAPQLLRHAFERQGPKPPGLSSRDPQDVQPEKHLFRGSHAETHPPQAQLRGGRSCEDLK